jgi:hypothetical protein
MWHVDYRDGSEQNFPSREEAISAANDVARREGRKVEIKA